MLFCECLYNEEKHALKSVTLSGAVWAAFSFIKLKKKGKGISKLQHVLPFGPGHNREKHLSQSQPYLQDGHKALWACLEMWIRALRWPYPTGTDPKLYGKHPNGILTSHLRLRLTFNYIAILVPTLVPMQPTVSTQLEVTAAGLGAAGRDKGWGPPCGSHICLWIKSSSLRERESQKLRLFGKFPLRTDPCENGNVVLHVKQRRCVQLQPLERLFLVSMQSLVLALKAKQEQKKSFSILFTSYIKDATTKTQ